MYIIYIYVFIYKVNDWKGKVGNVKILKLRGGGIVMVMVKKIKKKKKEKKKKKIFMMGVRFKEC